MLDKLFYYGCSVLLNRIFGLFPMQENRILFLSDVRGEMGGNFSFIYEKVKEDYEIKVSFKADRRIHHSLREWMLQSFYLATSGYIFLEDFAECTAFMHVRKGQELVQLWHGSGAYKKFGHSRAKNAADPVKIHPGYKRYTKAIVSSEFVRKNFAEAFSISEERVLATGIPETDVFFDSSYQAAGREKLLEKYPQCRDKKVILFAPTYRSSKVQDAYYDFDRLDFKLLYQELHETHVLLIKWHPALYRNLVRGSLKGPDIEKYPGFVMDVSSYRDMNDLLFITDLLITDYSSLIFDYALLRKPVIYFAYDLEEYAGGRGFYYPFETYQYGELVSNTKDLICAVRKEKLDEEKWSAFVEKFVSANDGRATEKVCEAIFGK